MENNNNSENILLSFATISTDDNPSSENMSSLDKLTLELLINKTQYKKYIQQTDPKKHSEMQLYLGKIKKYQNKIEHIFLSLLENPEIQITTDINTDFTHFVKTCIQYFESNTSDKYNQEDDDVLFDENAMETMPHSSGGYPGNILYSFNRRNGAGVSPEFGPSSGIATMWGNKIKKT